METSLPPGQRGRAKVKEGEIKVEMHYKPEGTKLRGPLLLVILHIVLGVDQLPNQSSQEGSPKSEFDPPVIPESLHYRGDKL